MSKEPRYRVGFVVASKEDAEKAAVELEVGVEAVCRLGERWAVVVNGTAGQVQPFAAAALEAGHELAVIGLDGNIFFRAGETRLFSAPAGAAAELRKTCSEDEILAVFSGMATALLFTTTFVTLNVVAPEGDATHEGA